MAKKYIDAEWLLDVVENIIEWDTERDRNRIIHQVRELTPTADVRENVRGEWTTKRTCEHDGELYCSNCGCDAPTEGDYRQVKTNFCPNCGADMRNER